MVNNQYINPWTKDEINLLKQKYPVQGFNLCEREIPHPLGVGMKANK